MHILFNSRRQDYRARFKHSVQTRIDIQKTNRIEYRSLSISKPLCSSRRVLQQRVQFYRSGAAEIRSIFQLEYWRRRRRSEVKTARWQLSSW